MARAPQARRIPVEEATGDVARVLSYLNPAMTDLNVALTGGLTFANMQAFATELSVAVPSPWTTATLASGWVKPNPAYATAGYYKDFDGTVRLRGVISGGTYSNSTPVFTLPASMAPASSRLFVVAQSSLTEGPGLVEVRSDGGVYAPVVTSIQSGTSTFLSLDGIAFEAGSIAPPPLGSPFPLYVDTTTLPSGPLSVFAVACTDYSSGSAAPAPLPQVGWNADQLGGRNVVKVSYLAGLLPGRKYVVRLVVMGF
jgi:hypothetical protein